MAFGDGWTPERASVSFRARIRAQHPPDSQVDRTGTVSAVRTGETIVSEKGSNNSLVRFSTPKKGKPDGFVRISKGLRAIRCPQEGTST